MPDVVEVLGCRNFGDRLLLLAVETHGAPPTKGFELRLQRRRQLADLRSQSLVANRSHGELTWTLRLCALLHDLNSLLHRSGFAMSTGLAGKPAASAMVACLQGIGLLPPAPREASAIVRDWAGQVPHLRAPPSHDIRVELHCRC